MNIPQPALTPKARAEKISWTGLLAATTINCAFQIAWFWRFRAHNINEDGIAYVGLARRLVDGDFKASLHGYWSPLTSWIIAAASVFGRNFTLLGRLVTIASFFLCLLLLYALRLRLWRSRTAAALAVFWFSAARGLVFLAVGSIVADFVLTASVLLYFILLLDALRQNKPAHWIPRCGSRASIPGQSNRHAMAFDRERRCCAVAKRALTSSPGGVFPGGVPLSRDRVGQLGSRPAHEIWSFHNRIPTACKSNDQLASPAESPSHWGQPGIRRHFGAL